MAFNLSNIYISYVQNEFSCMQNLQYWDITWKIKIFNKLHVHSNIMQKLILLNYREVSLAQESIPCISKSTEPVCSQVLL